MKLSRAAFLSLSATLLASSGASAVDEPNLELTHYGRLLGADERGISGTHEMSFALWASPVKLPNEPGVWTETYSVAFTDGLYSVVLGGDVTGKAKLPASKFDKTLYLSIAVDGGPELSPRQVIGRVPFAYSASVAGDVKCDKCIDASELSFDPTPADGSVTAAKLAAGAVTTAKLADGSVTAAKLATGAINADLLADGSVLSRHLAAGAVTAEKISGGAVGATQLAAGAVQTANIAAGAVTSAQLGEKAVLAANLDNLAVGTAQIADASVTSGKLAPNAINATHVAAGAIPWDRIESGQVPAARLPPISIAGKACAVGKVVTAFDSTGAPVCSDILSPAIGLNSFFPTKWAATLPGDRGTGELPVQAWYPTGNKTLFLKSSASSRLRVTVSDNLRGPVSTNGTEVYYEVRVNGSYLNPRCYANNYDWNGAGGAQNYHWPVSLTCLADMPAGFYEFATYVYGGSATPYSPYAHWNTGQPLILVEEIAADAKYGYTFGGSGQGTTSTTMSNVNGRTVTYTKAASSSVMRLTLSDTLRAAYNVNGGEGTVEIRMDGNPMPGNPCSYRKYDAQGSGGDYHTMFDMVCLYPNIGTGPHIFNVWFATGSAGQEAYLQRNRSYPLLMVEELAPGPTWDYSTGTGVAGELSVATTWTQVPGRSVTHVVSGDAKNIKLSYSDTWRAAYNCSGNWGSVGLYMDGQPIGCYTSMHVQAGSSAQDHHHALQLTCVARNVPAGSHVFTPWYYNNCGSSYFGRARGQFSMQAEELP